jgi:hypothetical protein
MADAIGLEQLDDARDLVDRTGLAGMHGDAEPELADAAEQAAIIGDAEGR